LTLGAGLALLALLASVAGCSGGSGPSSGPGGGTGDGTPGVDPSCVIVDMAVSPEKVTLLTDLAETFNASGAKVGDRCVAVRVARKSSGAAATLLEQGWPSPETNGPAPVIWSPAASGWAAIVNQKVGRTMAPAGRSFMQTPLVIAMPKPMADALGYPATPIGFADIVALANDPAGWAKYGHPEWGQFKLGKTNPNFSTSGLNFTVAEYYAATGKSSGLTVEDLNRQDVADFAKSVESAVVHYGDITGTFLSNWYRADARGTALTYTSAVAVEEKSILDYNSGNPDGELSPGESPRKPKVPLVAIYPKEGTLYSDSPFLVLDADWVTPEQRQAAQLFEDYVQQPENQARVLQYGFRPGNTSVAIGDPIVAANGVDPTEPQNVLAVPEPAVLVKVLDTWEEQRKAARVLLVIDVSGSMADPASQDSDATKLELARDAAITALDQFKDADAVGLRIFTTDLDASGATSVDLVPVGPMDEGQRTRLKDQIESLIPQNGTPLYQATQDAADTMRDAYDASAINAVVLLTDGVNDDGDQNDDADQLDQLIRTLRGGEGVNAKSVRVFPIAYGQDADTATLRRIAEASNGALYSASNPATINDVFTAVVSNF
jgi:Ca-activated chloride channel family protein